MILVLPRTLWLPVRPGVLLSCLASVVTRDPALPIEPASVLLPVLAPPSAIVRAWLLPCSVTGPVSVKETDPEPEDSMKVAPADKEGKSGVVGKRGVEGGVDGGRRYINKTNSNKRIKITTQ